MFENKVILPFSQEMPFSCRIPDPLVAGSLIIIEGRVNLEETWQSKFDKLYRKVAGDLEALAKNRFNINLMTSPDKEADIAFHFNPRFDQGCVVRNTREGGNWGVEERDPSTNPFAPGQGFNILILVEEDQFRVAVNGRHFIEYKHRIPFTSISIINIDGCVDIGKVEFRKDPRARSASISVPEPSAPPEPVVYPSVNDSMTSSTSSSAPEAAHSSQPTQSAVIHRPVYNPPIPFRYKIHEGIQPGLMVYISARCSASPHRFSVNFERSKEQDIPFHFNVRFDQRSVVRNTFTDGDWLEEDRAVESFPFMAGVSFDMIIRVETDKFLVAVNGQHFVEYVHRVHPIWSIDQVTIEGDLIVPSIKFNESDL